MPTSVRLAQWGNSIGVRLPKYVVNALGLEAGHFLDVSLDENRIIFRPTRKYRLEDLVSKITETNKPSEIDWGGDNGKERW